MELDALCSKLVPKQPCAVCGAENAQFRYGTVSCTSCASFFRRFVNSENPDNVCKCNIKGNIRICKPCRMKKCLEAGMKKSMVGFPSVGRKNRLEKNSSSFFLPILDIVVERSSDRLESVQVCYNILNSEREVFKEMRENSATMTFHDLSCLFVRDFNLVKRCFQNLHVELRTLSDFEKDAIFTNFFLGFHLFELAALPERYNSCAPSLSKVSFDRFHYRSNEKYNLSEDDLIRIFFPYYKYFKITFMKTIQNLKLDGIEIAFVLSLRLLDSGFSNISEGTIETCRALQKTILRELQSYYIEAGIEEKRLYDILEISEFIEKVESKFSQKFLLCETYGIKMDEGFRRIHSVAKL